MCLGRWRTGNRGDTEFSLFTGLNLHNNQAAGISLDLSFSHNTINDALITSNQTVGVFIRDSRFNNFRNVRVDLTKGHGIFLAQVDMNPETPATDNQFTDCILKNSGGAGIRLNNTNCVRNAALACVFENNAGGDISEVSTNLLIRGIR